MRAGPAKSDRVLKSGGDNLNRREVEELKEDIIRHFERKGWRHRRFFGNRHVDQLSKEFGGMTYRYLLLDDGMYAEFWEGWVDEEDQEWITLWFADWDHIKVHPARPNIYVTIKL